MHSSIKFGRYLFCGDGKRAKGVGEGLGWGRGLYNHKRMMSRGISIRPMGKGLNWGNNWDKTFLGSTFPQWSDAFKGQLAKQLERERRHVCEALTEQRCGLAGISNWCADLTSTL